MPARPEELRMLTIGLATCAKVPDLTADDRLLLDELLRRGVDARAVVWDDLAVSWTTFERVMIRSCWDYTLRSEAFLAWMASLEEAGVSLWNPAGLVRWNHHKGYLQDLERSGIPIVPTVFLKRGAEVSIAALLEERGWTDAVVKPAVSASAYRTSRVSLADAAPAQEAVDALLADGDVLVQRFLPEIASLGEWSLIFIAGAFSHALLKRPASGDFRVQVELGGSAVCQEPPTGLFEQAQTVARHIPEPWLFARLDGVDLAGVFTIMEVELIEPFLFLADEPLAPARLAEALTARTG
jgi:glutathione synthase/RimK-type ligase-like ATP-grasp enzyme